MSSRPVRSSSVSSGWACERVGRGQQYAELLIGEMLGGDCRRQRQRGADEAEVDLAGVEHPELVDGGACFERDRAVRETFGGELFEGGRDVAGDPVQQAEAEHRLVQAGGPARVLQRQAGRLEGFPGAGEQDLPGRGELDAAAVPDQQGGADLAFELLDLLAERRGGDVQALGGLAEMQLLGDAHEVPQLPKLHLVILFRLAISLEGVLRGGRGWCGRRGFRGCGRRRRAGGWRGRSGGARRTASGG